MNYKVQGSNVLIPGSFSLSATFDCGQCFRFMRGEDGRWCGTAFGRSLCLYEEDGNIVFENVTEKDYLTIWSDYFDLDFDYGRFWETACANETLFRIVHTCAPEREKTLHILRQEPFETLCSFLISQNNNIPRIRLIIRALCENFGERIEAENYAFPEPEALARLSEENLAPLRCGYRARYLIDAARKVANGQVDLAAIVRMETEKGREELLKILGVGKKVADCVLLYGFHKMDAFPVDVWMRRAMERYFPGESPACFGGYAGLAQQYIFSYIRAHAD